MRGLFTSCAAMAFSLALGLPLCAQETRGAIFGRVLDPQSSAVASASVVIRETETNTFVRLQTNETGYYEANLLIAGEYTITVEAPGFRKAIRQGVGLQVSGRAEVNFNLDLGAVTESVSVTAEAPMLDTSSVSSGRVIDNRSLQGLPLISNLAVLLVKLAPGVQTTGVTAKIGMHSTGQGSDYTMGGVVGGNEWSIDGVPNNGASRAIAYLPHTDTIQEFKVETANFDAAVGHTTGVSVSMMTKTGTNALHGAGTLQHWQQRWVGASFFVKQLYYRNIADALAKGDRARADYLGSQPIQPSGRDNNYSASVGGPVYLPKIYNGKDKLFFFFNFSGLNDARTERADSISRTIPTLAARQGDFSQLLSVDAGRYQIYDPLSVRPDPARATHYIRDAIPGNILPASRIVNPVYKTYNKFLPTPNNDPANPRLEPLNNFQGVAQPNIFYYYSAGSRVDYQHSERHRFFGRWSWSYFEEDRNDWTYETARLLQTSGLNRRNAAGTVDWVWTRSARTMFNAAIATNEYKTGNKPGLPATFKPSDVGLPAYLDQHAGSEYILPYMQFSGYESLSRNGYPSYTRYRMLTGKFDGTHILSNHTLRGGVDVRGHYRTGGGGGNTSGSFSFSNLYTRRNDDTFTPAGDLGHSWAAFMMGIPTSATVAATDSFVMSNPYFGWFAQDNWRITPRLSLNLGLRVEYELGPIERYDRMIGAFDPTATLPISQAAQAAYSQAPVPERGASDFVVRGGSLYPGGAGQGRRLYQNELMWLPRLSAAWQVNGRTVVRAGYGVYYDTLNVLNQGPDQTGFCRTTSTTLTNNFGIDWLAGDPRRGISPMSDPFPLRSDGTRFDNPTRDKLGLMTMAGRSFTYSPLDTRHARQQRWRVGIQRQISANMLLDVAYAGTSASNVYVNQSLSPLPAQYWADGLARNDAVANNMNANVTNPFLLKNFTALATSSPLVYKDLSTNSFFTSPTIRKNQLIRPFPAMSGLALRNAPYGEVRTDALEVSFEKRFSRGFNLNAAYTRLRGRVADFYQNEFDPAPTWRDSSDGMPHRFTIAGVYEFPFGKGRRFAKAGLWSVLFGGFQTGVTYEYQPGPLLSFGNLFYYGSLPDIDTGARTLDRWFNTAGFERSAAKGPAAFHKRVFPTLISGLRANGTNQWNANMQRDFRFRERASLQIRLDMVNLQNRSQFAAPDTNPFSTNFGKITAATANANRFIQLQGRIRF